jgi:hypothetical protein
MGRARKRGWVSAGTRRWPQHAELEVERPRAITVTLQLRRVAPDIGTLHSPYPSVTYELYDMINVYGQPGMEAKRTELAQRLDTFFASYADPKCNIWKGGVQLRVTSCHLRLRTRAPHSELDSPQLGGQTSAYDGYPAS